MSMPISERRRMGTAALLVPLVIALTIAAAPSAFAEETGAVSEAAAPPAVVDDGETAALTDTLPDGPSGTAPEMLAPAPAPLPAQELVVTGPEGYCVDPDSRSERSGGKFVMLGSCAALGAGNGAAPARPALLTALVSAPGAATARLAAPEAVSDFFASEAGRAALAHDGEAGSVQILDSSVSGDVVVLKIADTSRADIPGLGDTSWRAVFMLSDRLVVLSVNAHPDSPLEDEAAKATLADFVAAVRAGNSATPDMDAL